jgi:hypothetical protein
MQTGKANSLVATLELASFVNLKPVFFEIGMRVFLGATFVEGLGILSHFNMV